MTTRDAIDVLLSHFSNIEDHADRHVDLITRTIVEGIIAASNTNAQKTHGPSLYHRMLYANYHTMNELELKNFSLHLDYSFILDSIWINCRISLKSNSLRGNIMDILNEGLTRASIVRDTFVSTEGDYIGSYWMGSSDLGALIKDRNRRMASSRLPVGFSRTLNDSYERLRSEIEDGKLGEYDFSILYFERLCAMLTESSTSQPALKLPFKFYRNIYTIIHHLYQEKVEAIKKIIAASQTESEIGVGLVTGGLREIAPFSKHTVDSNLIKMICRESHDIQCLRTAVTTNPLALKTRQEATAIGLIHRYKVSSDGEYDKMVVLNVNEMLKVKGGLHYNFRMLITLFAQVAETYQKTHDHISIDADIQQQRLVLYGMSTLDIANVMQSVAVKYLKYTLATGEVNDRDSQSILASYSYKSHRNLFTNINGIPAFFKKYITVYTLGIHEYSDAISLWKDLKNKCVKVSKSSAFTKFCYDNNNNIGCAKVMICGMKNYNLFDARGVDKCKADMETIYNRMVAKNVYKVKYKNSMGYEKCGLEIFTNDLSQINIVKLFGIKKYTVMVPDGMTFMTRDEITLVRDIFS